MPSSSMYRLHSNTAVKHRPRGFIAAFIDASQSCSFLLFSANVSSQENRLERTVVQMHLILPVRVISCAVVSTELNFALLKKTTRTAFGNTF